MTQPELIVALPDHEKIQADKQDQTSPAGQYSTTAKKVNALPFLKSSSLISLG